MDQEPAAGDIFLYSQDNESSPCFSYTSKSEITAVELARLLGFVALRVRGSIRLLIHEKCPPGHFILIPLAGGQLLLNAGDNITAPTASHNRVLLSPPSTSNGKVTAQKNAPSISPAVATALTQNSKGTCSSEKESESSQSDVNKPRKNNTTPRVSKVSASFTVSPRKQQEQKKTKESEDEDHNVDANNNADDDKKQEIIRYLDPATWESTVATNRKFDQEVQEILEVI